MPARRIKVRRETAEFDEGLAGQYLALRVSVVQAIGYQDTAVFLFQRYPATAQTGETVDKFLTVCSPVDVADHPPGAPDPGADPPRFRLPTVTLYLRSTAELEETYELLLDRLSQLDRASDRLEALGDPREEWADRGAD